MIGGASGFTRDNAITNNKVARGQLPPNRAEIYPQQTRQSLNVQPGRGVQDSTESIPPFPQGMNAVQNTSRYPMQAPSLQQEDPRYAQPNPRPEFGVNPQSQGTGFIAQLLQSLMQW